MVGAFTPALHMALGRNLLVFTRERTHSHESTLRFVCTPAHRIIIDANHNHILKAFLLRDTVIDLGRRSSF